MNLKEVFKKAIANDVVFEGKKIKTEDIIKQFPDGIAIDDVTVYIDENGEQVFAYSFMADGEKYYAFAGDQLKRAFLGAMQSYDGDDLSERDFDKDLEHLREDLQKEAVWVRLSQGSTKKGRPITLVEFM